MQAILVGTLVSAQEMDSDLFPRPAELEPAINFWIRVYTEIDTDSGFLHDSEDLSIIYAQLTRNNQSIELRRQQIKDNLAVLASGKRSDLTLEQEEILGLWPDNVSDQRLKNAIDNVRFQLGQSNAFLDGLERSGAYRDSTADILQNKNLPLALARLPHVESSFNPNAYSSADAVGMWQFTRPTGQRFMRIDEIIDERLDPYISAKAAMDLLEYNHQVLGTWPLAITAYNQGVGGMSRAVRETGTTAIEDIIASYKGSRFRFVGRNFYAQFLAVNEIEDNIQLYFKDVQFAAAPEYTEVRLDAFISARTLAETSGITLANYKWITHLFATLSGKE
jgi:membrane-bound lytic murein transglycosylase D